MSSELEKKLIIFKKVNVHGREKFGEHQNVIASDKPADVLKNQGISRAKFRKFIKENGGDEDFWTNI